MKNIFKLNLTFLIFALLFTGCAYAKDIKFVQVTDSHFSSIKDGYTQREVENSQDVLIKTIDDINSVPDVDFVVFTGDNIDQANPDELKNFLKIANNLKPDYYVVIGNHEVFKSQNLTKVDYMKIVSENSKNCKFKTPNYEFKRDGLVFLVVDGAKEIIPGPAGYYKKDTLKWLDKKLTQNKNNKVVIFQHFPIVAPYYNRTHTTYDAKDYEAILAKHKNVIGIFSGHYHANGEQMVNGVYHVSTPALVEPPHNFKVVEIEKQGNSYQIYTQLRHAE